MCLMEQIRNHIDSGTFDRFKQEPYTLWINQFNQYRKSVDPDCDEAFEVKF